MRNYAFYISGNSSRCFKFLKQASDDILSKIKLIVSDKVVTNEEFLDIISKNRINLKIYEHKTLPGKTVKERNLVLSNLMKKNFDDFTIDYCISHGSHILSGELLEAYKYHIINFHPALLPMFPGRAAIDQAVDHGNVLLVGNTAHFIDSGMDTGPIIMQSVIPLNALYKDNGKDYNKILDLQIEMLNKLFYILNNDLIEVTDNKVKILNADYEANSIFPAIMDNAHIQGGGYNRIAKSFDAAPLLLEAA